jgi:hypothetical protein
MTAFAYGLASCLPCSCQYCSLRENENDEYSEVIQRGSHACVCNHVDVLKTNRFFGDHHKIEEWNGRIEGLTCRIHCFSISFSLTMAPTLLISTPISALTLLTDFPSFIIFTQISSRICSLTTDCERKAEFRGNGIKSPRFSRGKRLCPCRSFG